MQSFNDTGYDEDGYNEDGYDRYGYDRYGYNMNGYDKDGYNKDGYNMNGYDRDGYNRSGYSREGYNKQGYNRQGFNNAGYSRIQINENGYCGTKYASDWLCCRGKKDNTGHFVYANKEQRCEEHQHPHCIRDEGGCKPMEGPYSVRPRLNTVFTESTEIAQRNWDARNPGAANQGSASGSGFRAEGTRGA